MDQRNGIVLTIALGALFYLISQQAIAMNQPSNDAGSNPDDPLPADFGLSLDQKVNAFLALIRRYESGDNYAAQAGTSQQITDFSHHPAVYRTVTINGRNIRTSAAGAYQFILGTWNAIAAQAGIVDFSPASQDLAAYTLLNKTGAVDALNADNLTLALTKASTQWASLPGSTAGQNPQSLAQATADYTALLTG